MTVQTKVLSKMLGYVVLIVLTLHCIHCNIRWLSLDDYPKNALWEKNDVCSKLYGLSIRQQKFCRKRFPWMTFVQQTATETKNECMTQFKSKHWDCTSVTTAPRYDADLKHDTRESAYLHALSTASLALNTARGCLEGRLSECSCLHTKPHLSFPSEMVNEKNLSNIDRLLGCKDISKLGHRFAKSFMMVGFRSRPKTKVQKQQSAIRFHNINIGLKELYDSEEVFCTCNGATDGCIVKYCHRRIKPLQQIAKRLTEKYDKALKANREILKLISYDKSNEKDSSSTYYQVSKKYENNLIFLTDAPDPCKRINGFHINKGRECSPDSSGDDSCNKLCCEMGYEEKMIIIEAKCNCKFIYCCRVECEVCKSTRRIFQCL